MPSSARRIPWKYMVRRVDQGIDPYTHFMKQSRFTQISVMTGRIIGLLLVAL